MADLGDVVWSAAGGTITHVLLEDGRVFEVGPTGELVGEVTESVDGSSVRVTLEVDNARTP